MDEQAAQRVSYGTHERQRATLYQHLQPFGGFESPIPALVFVHGGAWRDPANTDKDADAFAQNLNPAVPLCSVDYRLSDEVRHPAFQEDVLQATQRCLQELGASSVSFIGHSVGAMLAIQCINALPSHISVTKLYLVEGIYDLPELVREYPDYKFFVDDAHDDYTEVSLSLDKLKDIEVHIIQSYEDELLSMGQTSWLQKELLGRGIQFHLHVAHLGKHNEVYVNQKLAEYVNRTYC